MKLANIALCAALALGVAGCSDNASAPSADYNTPKVAEGAACAFGSDADSLLAHAKEATVALEGREAADELFKGGLAAIKKQLPPEVAAKFDEAGIDIEKLQWVLVTGGIPELTPGEEPPFKNLQTAAAVRIDHDFAKLKAFLIDAAKDDEDDVKLAETTIAGASALEIKPVKEKDVKDMAAAGVAPVIGSLDGKILVLASTPAEFEKQVKLYKEGKGASREFASFGIAPFGIKFTQLDKIVASVNPDAGEMEKSVRAFEVACDGGKTKVNVVFDTVEHASAVRALVKMGFDGNKEKIKAMIASEKLPQALADAVDAVVIGGEDSDTVSIVIPVHAELLAAVAAEAAVEKVVGPMMFGAPSVLDGEDIPEPAIPVHVEPTE